MRNLPGSGFFRSCWLLVLTIVLTCKNSEQPGPAGILQLISVQAGDFSLSLDPTADNAGVPVDSPISIRFSSAIDTDAVQAGILLLDNQAIVPVKFQFDSLFRTVDLVPLQHLKYNYAYRLDISDKTKGLHRETFAGIKLSFTTAPEALKITSLIIGGKTAGGPAYITGVPLSLNIVVHFSGPVDEPSVNSQAISLSQSGQQIPLDFKFSNQDSVLEVTSNQKLKNLARYLFSVSGNVKGMNDEMLTGFSASFYTTYDSVPVLPEIPDSDLLTLVQKQTFKYFWDFAHPVSGLARERNSSGDLVTSGGSGFGIMALLVGIQRGFITRQEGVGRLQKIVDFLGQADRFHGAWPHWLDGTTGKVIPFSTMDDGGDLVETSYLCMGLLTARQYLNPADSAENLLITKINDLWNGVEWNWYTQGGQKILYWHWSPDYGWAMNMPVQGWNEALITYILAASSSDYSIDADVYSQGWAGGSSFVNGRSYYGYLLPLGPDYGGPLFFAHYTFMGINPHGLSDTYADYLTQNINHTLINREYCTRNPGQYIGYGPGCWGLTASDEQNGYSAHSPTNDRGVITPTAAISSLPYTPGYSMEAIRFFYYTLGDRLWGDYGFYDAFNLTSGWTADSYLAIDEGPEIVMIENFRTGLLWDLFMSCPEVQSGLTRLGFTRN